MWETDVAKSEFSAKNPAKTMMENRSSSRSGATSTATTSNSISGGWFGTGSASFSIVGMDTTKVSGVVDTFETWITGLESHLEDIKAEADANKAFKGEEVQKAMENYIGKVKLYCITLCSQYRAFQHKLIDAQKAWGRGVASMAETISSRSTDEAFDTGVKFEKPADETIV